MLSGLKSSEGRWELATELLPCLAWMRTYHKYHGGVAQRLLRDVLAGLAVSCLIVPQALSYAQVAGLPGQYGLCAPPCRDPSRSPALHARAARSAGGSHPAGACGWQIRTSCPCLSTLCWAQACTSKWAPSQCCLC